MKLSDTETVERWRRHRHCNVTAMKVTNSLLSLLDRNSRPIILLLLSMFRNTRGGFIWITQATLSDSDHIISKGTLSYINKQHLATVMSLTCFQGYIVLWLSGITFMGKHPQSLITFLALPSYRSALIIFK